MGDSQFQGLLRFFPGPMSGCVRTLVGAVLVALVVGCGPSEARVRHLPDPGRTPLDAILFRIAMEHAGERDGPIRVDPRVLMGWREREPIMSEAPAEVVAGRRAILSELSIPETDARYNNRCPLNPWAEDYSACAQGGTFYGFALELARVEPDGERCRTGDHSRCVIGVMIQTITERGAARRFDHYWFGWDASSGRWELEETINQYTT